MPHRHVMRNAVTLFVCKFDLCCP